MSSTLQKHIGGADKEKCVTRKAMPAQPLFSYHALCFRQMLLYAAVVYMQPW